MGKRKGEQAGNGTVQGYQKNAVLYRGPGDSRGTFLVPRSARAARTPQQQHSTLYLFSANAAAVRAIRLAPTLLVALHGEAGGRKKICAGRGRSATPGFPVNVRWWKSLR